MEFCASSPTWKKLVWSLHANSIEPLIIKCCFKEIFKHLTSGYHVYHAFLDKIIGTPSTLKIWPKSIFFFNFPYRTHPVFCKLFNLTVLFFFRGGQNWSVVLHLTASNQEKKLRKKKDSRRKKIFHRLKNWL